MDCARQRYNLGHFYFIGYRCVEKFMTGFRIDSHTIKTVTCLHIGRLVPLERSNFVYVLESSGVVSRETNSIDKIFVKS